MLMEVAMSYTDKELIRASQIAYFTINDRVLEQVGKQLLRPIAEDAMVRL